MNLRTISWFSFLFLILFHGSSDTDELFYKSCGATFSCSDAITGIEFPFRGIEDPLYCGHPSLALACDDQTNITNINIVGTKYRVLEIDQRADMMRVAREDIMEEDCPREKVNTTLDYSVFDYDASSKNFTFLYGCPSLPDLSYITCGKETVYVIPGSMGPGACETSVIVPGTWDEAGGPPNTGRVNTTELDRAIQKGFQIKWKAASKECSDCSDSKGRCGYSSETNRSVCYCPDPPYISDRTCAMAEGASQTPDKAASPNASSESSGPAGTIVGTLLSVIGTIVVTTAIVWCLRRRCLAGGRGRGRGPNRANKEDVDIILDQCRSLPPKRYKYSKIKKMTNSFKDKLGHGGYGSVYKGKLTDGTLVAVKVLAETDSNGEEFINEVASISRTSHVNIVTLLGFCYEEHKRALVYEYMPNKSLDNFLNNNGSGTDCCLDLEKLYKIAVGIAKGLEYLHTGCKTRIVHFDIKPQNILLDEDFSPRISDFGLAKLCKKKQSILSVLGTRGTVGYIAPEMFSRNFGGVSHKSDVYSYGMMVLEMAGARNIVEAEADADQSSENYFPDKIYERVLNNVTRKVDESVIADEDETTKKMFLVGFWCIQTTPSDRPTMSKVVEMLEGDLQSIQIPPKPFLFAPALPEQITSSFSENVESENSTEDQPFEVQL